MAHKGGARCWLWLPTRLFVSCKTFSFKAVMRKETMPSRIGDDSDYLAMGSSPCLRSFRDNGIILRH